MKALMIFGLLMGIISMSITRFDYNSDNGTAQSIAVNYAIYRNAAFLYADNNKSASGIISQASLDLPIGYKLIRPWTAQIHNKCCYVYGEASYKEIEETRKIFQGSIAVGYAYNAQIMPQPANSVPLPSFIPNNNIVSVMEVK